MVKCAENKTKAVYAGRCEIKFKIRLNLFVTITCIIFIMKNRTWFCWTSKSPWRNSRNPQGSAERLFNNTAPCCYN